MRILVFQHVDVEHPAAFRDFWREAGITWDAVELDEGEPIPDLDPYDLLVVMGGPQDVWQEDLHPWLVPEKAAIKRWVTDLRRPYLGVCLGHQLLAEAVGGTVELGARSEVGPTPARLTLAGREDPLFEGIAADLMTFQWHSAEVTSLPKGAVVLAENDVCAIQALRFGECAYGLQYHVELTQDTIPEWRAIPAYKASLAEAVGEDNVPAMVADTEEKLPEFRKVARRLNSNLMQLVQANRFAAT
ncbi:MAG: type 1 glutamine amidotransferase [Pseudomonadota bacterium]